MKTGKKERLDAALRSGRGLSVEALAHHLCVDRNSPPSASAHSYTVSLGLGALTAGLLLLPGGLLMGLMAPAVGRAFDKIGARKLVIPGTLLVSAALWMMSFFGMETPVWLVLAAHVLLSLGLSLLFTPLFTSGLGSLPQDLHHYGSAVVGTIQQVCGAAGIALYVSVMSLYGSAALEAGAAAAAANAAGVSAAFATAAIVSVVMIAVSVFVRRPKDMLPNS